MSVFRVEKNSNYTVMSNYHLRDKNLSNKSKGLLSIILSLPDEWDYTSEGLARICKDGIESIRTQLRELEECGYITRERTRNERGQLKGCDYTIHEKPVINSDTDKPIREKPILGNPIQGNPTQGNRTQSNKDILNTNSSNNQSINQRKIDMDRKDIEEKISEQIGVDSFADSYSEEQAKEVVSLIADVICSPQETVRINGTDIDKQTVIDRLNMLNEEHIRYVFDAMERCSSKINNIRSYLITALYNAPATTDNYYTALFNANRKE